MADNSLPLDVAQLVLDHHQVLYRYAFRLTGSVPDAEDLTQQVFLVAQQKLDQVRAAENVRAWLFAILRNCYLKGFRRPAPALAGNLDFDMENVPEEPIDGLMSDSPIDGERLQIVLNELPDEFRVVVLMFYYEERSYREIAESLGVPIGTVMSRLSRAKGHLRRRLSEREPRQAPSRGGAIECETGSSPFPQPVTVRR